MEADNQRHPVDRISAERASPFHSLVESRDPIVHDGASVLPFDAGRHGVSGPLDIVLTQERCSPDEVWSTTRR